MDSILTCCLCTFTGADVSDLKTHIYSAHSHKLPPSSQINSSLGGSQVTPMTQEEYEIDNIFREMYDQTVYQLDFRIPKINLVQDSASGSRQPSQSDSPKKSLHSKSNGVASPQDIQDSSERKTEDFPRKRKPRTCPRSLADGKPSISNKADALIKIGSDHEEWDIENKKQKSTVQDQDSSESGYKEESLSDEEDTAVNQNRDRSQSTAAAAEIELAETPVQVFGGLDVSNLCGDYDEEKRADSSKRQFRCDQCDKVLPSRASLNIHYKDIHSKEVFITMNCEICSIKVSFFNIYTHHVGTEVNQFGKVVYTCDVCSKSYDTKSSCSRHIRSSHTTGHKMDEIRQQIDESKSNKCNICKTGFLWRKGLLNHNKQRHSVKPAVVDTSAVEGSLCLICDEKILGLCIFSHHIVASDESENIYTCNICVQEFNMKQDCSRHIRDDHLAAETLIEQAREKFGSQFYCNICQKATSLEAKFSHHIITQKYEEPDQNVIICNICSASFTVLEECQKHLSVIHYKLSGISKMEDTFYCLTCDTMVLESERYSHHMEVTTKRNGEGWIVDNFKCNVCNKEFNNLKFCKLHMINHLDPIKRKDKLTFCKICNETVKSHDKLSHHITVTRIDQNRYNYACNICNKSYNHVKYCRAHLTSSHIIELCFTCGKEVSAGNWNYHQETHKQAPPRCSECNEIFKDSIIYRAHMNEKHGVFIKNTRVYKRPYLCDSCGRSFKGRADLAVHVATHKEELCKICNQRVTSVKVHMRKHAKLLKLKCDVCGILCASDESIAKHKLRNHTRQKTFACNYCAERFPTALKRIEHKALVHGLKHMLEALKCDTCGKVVSTPYSKKKHMITAHGGQKPFPCGQCNKGFFAISGLIDHAVKIHTKIRDYNCMHCGRGLINASRLEYHVNAFHKGVQPPDLGEQRLSTQPLQHKGNIQNHQLTASQVSD